jgi:hypothetical protein
MEGLWLAVDQNGNLILSMQVFAVCTTTVGPPTGTFAFYDGARQHLAKLPKTAYEPATQLDVGVRISSHSD